MALLLVVIGIAGSCGGSDAPQPVGASGDDAEADEATAEDAGPARPFEVETTSLTLVDDSRPTDHPDDRWDAPTRSLETTIYVPQGDGAFPLVVQAHGFEGHPRKFTQLMTSWAAAGYVVALPVFPLTNDAGEAPRVLGDYVNQPADVAFVVDQILDLAAADDPALGGRVDPERIAVSGHSLGGVTAYGLAFNDCCRDDRLDAAILMSTLPLPFAGGSYDFSGVPLLLLQLTEDPLVPYDAAVTTFTESRRPKFLVTLEGGIHPEPYEDAPSPHDGVVEATTIAFLDAYVGDDPSGADHLVEAVESSDGATVEAVR
ncbi:MAG: alpha/beta hydrolase family protein [Acidimicrobiales bacterium]